MIEKAARFHRALLVPLLFCVACPAAKEDDEPQPDAKMCANEIVATGTVAGTAVDAKYSTYDATWFNTSVEEKVLDSADEDTMKQLGLDPSDQDDVDRFIYFTKAYDLRLILMEPNKGLLDPSKRELGMYFFDLAADETQPGTKVEVFDASSVEKPRNAKDEKALGVALRKLIDTLRDDGKPNVVVAFSPDRSDEGLRGFLINLLGENTYFATSGSASFDAFVDEHGKTPQTLDYPIASTGTLAYHAAVKFGTQAIRADAACMSVVLSSDE